VTLGSMAFSRSGDRGDVSNVSVIARDPRDYPWLAAHVAANLVQAHLGDIVRGRVTRYELPAIGALNFVLERALGGGATRSLALDAHGKSLSSLLLTLELPDATPDARRGPSSGTSHP